MTEDVLSVVEPGFFFSVCDFGSGDFDFTYIFYKNRAEVVPPSFIQYPSRLSIFNLVIFPFFIESIG